MASLLHVADELRGLRDRLRDFARLDSLPSIQACRAIATSLDLLARRADALEARAREADEMEEVARDLDVVASAADSPALQAALKDEQRLIQTQLDAGGDLGPVHVPRSAGLAALAAPFGDSNVVSFPVAPRTWQPRLDCQGDDGDAA